MTEQPYRTMHMGRHWSGNEPERDCPCPKAACGLVEGWDEGCEHHAPKFTHTMRQVHLSERCPAYVPF